MRKITYMKLALYTWKKQRMIAFLVLFQLIIMFMLGLSCISMIHEKFPLYNSVQSLLKGDGIVIQSYGIEDELRAPVHNKEILAQTLDSTNAFSSYNVWAAVYKGKESMDFEVRAYDEEIINAYKPKIETGRWLSDEANDKILYAVISQNPYGIDVGDRILLYDVLAEKQVIPVETEIIGLLENNAMVSGFSTTTSNQTDYRNLYQSTNYEYLSKPLLLLSAEQLQKVNTKMGNNYLVMQAQNLSWLCAESPKQLDECKTTLLQDGVTILGEFDEIRETNNDIFFQELFQIFPIFLCAFIMCLITEVSIGAIIGRNMQRNYGIYRLCGLNKRGCFAIQALSFLYVIGSALSIAIIVGKYLSEVGLFSETVIRIEALEIVCLLVIMAINLILASIIPARILANANISEML